MVRRAARLLGAELTEDGAREIARRSRAERRGSPGRLLRRVRDFAHAAGGNAVIDAELADTALSRLEIDALGLDAMDRRYLTMIADLYGGGPVGVETLAAGLSEPRDTIEDVIEPFLIQLGLIARTGTRALPQRPRLRPPRARSAGRGPVRIVRSGRLSRSNAPRPLLASLAALFIAAARQRRSPPRGRHPTIPSDSAWLCLPGRSDVCSTPLRDDRARPERLWRGRAQPVAKDPAPRLLLRLPDGLDRSGTE